MHTYRYEQFFVYKKAANRIILKIELNIFFVRLKLMLLYLAFVYIYQINIHITSVTSWKPRTVAVKEMCSVLAFNRTNGKDVKIVEKNKSKN